MGRLFCAGRGVTQGRPLSAKLFNILVNTVAREWVRQLREESEQEEAYNRTNGCFFCDLLC